MSGSNLDKQRAARLSMAASGVIVVGKVVVALLTGSLGVLSEALHSAIDFGATVVTWFAVRWADLPPDDDHHYGHAKIESVAALLEAVLLGLTAVFVAYEAVHRLWANASPPQVEWWAFAVMGIAIAIDFNRSRVLRKVAAETASDALAADALHFESDIYGSLAVLIGLFGIWVGLPWADSAAALVVSGLIGWIGYGLGRHTLATLMDRAPDGLSDRVREIVEHHDAVLRVSQIRMRQVGPTQFVAITVDVARSKPMIEIATVKEDIISALKAALPHADVSLIAQPVALDGETAFEKVAMIAAERKLSVHHLTVQNIQGHLAVSFDLEVDGTTTLLDAHEKATELEDAIRHGLGNDVEVESHIEPQPVHLLEGAPAPKAVSVRVEQSLRRFGLAEKQLHDIHNVRVRQAEGGLFVHYHCRFQQAMNIDDVHGIVDRLENRLQGKFKTLKRVVAHAEPLGRARHKL